MGRESHKRVTCAMQRLADEHHTTIDELLKDYVGVFGLRGAARKLGISKGSMVLWMKRLGLKVEGRFIPRITSHYKSKIELMTEEQALMLDNKPVLILDINQGLLRRCPKCQEYWPHTLDFWTKHSCGYCRACSLEGWKINRRPSERDFSS